MHTVTADERLDLIRYYLGLAHDNHPDGHESIARALAERLDEGRALTEDERRALD